MKKILIILGLLILAGLGVAGYLYLSGASSKTTQTELGEYELKKISDDEVISPVPSYEGDAVWYFNSKGRLFRRALNDSGFTEYVLPDGLNNFSKAYWPSSGNDFIFTTTGISGTTFIYYDNAAEQFKPLPPNIQALDWMPDGRRILYVWKSGDGKSQQLFLANADTSGYRKISDLLWSDFEIKISPDGKQALLIRRPALDKNEIYLVNLESGENKVVVDQGKNIEATWIDSAKFLYVESIDAKNNLKVYDINSKQTANLGLSATLDKVAVDKQGRYIYVNISGANDKMLKVDMQTNQQKEIYSFDIGIQPRNLFLNSQTLMFVNSLDGKLYSLGQ